MTPPDAQQTAPDPETARHTPLELVQHVPDLLGEPHGFGGFLFDPQGRPVIEDGGAWLYTTRLAENGWDSWIRRLDIATLRPDPAKRILLPEPGYDRAVLHHAIAAANDLIVGLYCDGIGFSAAIAPAPDAPFVQDPGFSVRPEIGWETRGEAPGAWSLECNGAHVLIEDSANATEFWQGYDSYRPDGRLGDLGWIRVRIDKRRRTVAALDRHPGNPLAFRQPHWSCVRCGGNLSGDLTVAGRRPFFYYVRPDQSRFFIGMALSADPLFFDGVEHHVLGGALDDEEVAEKFEGLPLGDELLLFYESRHGDGSWRTGLRRFRQRR